MSLNEWYDDQPAHGESGRAASIRPLRTTLGMGAAGAGSRATWCGNCRTNRHSHCLKRYRIAHGGGLHPCRCPQCKGK